tara:strand:- start:139 stop:561 length:423 start_codon:yes stop_codon:yes gene_type:complete
MTDESSHADYIYARDKKFKENLNSTKVSQRIVPEVSGKKKLLETSFDTEIIKNENVDHKDSHEKEKKVTFKDDIDSNIPFEKLLIILQKSESLLTNEEKKECVRILKCRQSNILIITICIIIASMFTSFILYKNKLHWMN